jgi:hypothetical protein
MVGTAADGTRRRWLDKVEALGRAAR